MACDSQSVYESLEQCPGQRNTPGIRRRLFYINKIDIAAWPALPRPGDNGIGMADLAVYDGDFTLKADKYFQFIDLKPESSNVTFETVGDGIGSKMVNNQVNAIVSGMPDEVKGFARQALNDDLVYVYQQTNGKFCVIGNEAYTCNTNPSGDTGSSPTDASTTTLGIQCYDECPVPTYTGKLPIAASKYIDCADGKEKNAA